MKKFFNVRTVIMLFVLSFFTLLAVGSGDKSSDSPSSFTTKQSGENVTVTTYTIGCFNKSDEEEVLKMMNNYNGDDTYFDSLVAEGKAVTIAEGTSVQIVEKEFGMLKVSTSEGAVWISTSCVK